MSVKEFEDNRWKKQDQQTVFRHKAAVEMIDDGKVLDLGCGDGLFLCMLREKGISGYGLDLSSDAVKKCIAKGIKAEVCDFAGKPLPFPDDTFDYVVMLDVLEHLYYPEKVLAEARRVSKKFVVISVPNFNALPSRIHMLRGDVPENNRHHKGHIFWFNFKNLKSILENVKLATIDLKTNTFWQQRPIVGDAIQFFSKIAPNLFALSFVVKVEKK